LRAVYRGVRVISIFDDAVLVLAIAMMVLLFSEGVEYLNFRVCWSESL